MQASKLEWQGFADLKTCTWNTQWWFTSKIRLNWTKSKDDSHEAVVFAVFWTKMNQQPFGRTYFMRDGGFPVAEAAVLVGYMMQSCGKCFNYSRTWVVRQWRCTTLCSSITGDACWRTASRINVIVHLVAHWHVRLFHVEHSVVADPPKSLLESEESWDFPQGTACGSPSLFLCRAALLLPHSSHFLLFVSPQSRYDTCWEFSLGFFFSSSCIYMKHVFCLNNQTIISHASWCLWHNLLIYHFIFFVSVLSQIYP